MFKIIFLISLLFTSCSHIKVVPGRLNLQKFLLLQQTKLDTFRICRAKFNFSVSESKNNLSGNVRLVSQDFDKMRFEVFDPFGRIQFIAILFDKTFLATILSKKEVYEDNYGGIIYMNSFLLIPLPFRDLIMLILGILPDKVRHKGLSELEWLPDRKVYITSLVEKNTNNWNIYIDTEGNIKEIFYNVYEKEISITYDDISAFLNTQIADEVNLKVMPSNVLLEVSLKNIEKLKEPLKSEIYHYEIPSNFKKRILK